MSFESDIARFVARTEKRLKAVHANAAFKVRDSVIFGPQFEGGRITGAPGQPVDTGNLRASWQLTHPEALLALLTATGETPTGVKVGYARAIEEGIQAPYTTTKGTRVTPRKIVFGKHGGGPHSVKLTRAGFQRLVDKAAREEKND